MEKSDGSSIRHYKEFPVSPWPEWKIIEKVGEGSFGCVYKAERNEKGHTFYSAIKVITIPGSDEEWESVLLEAGSEEGAKAYYENLLEDCIQEAGTMEFFHGNSYIVSVEDFKVLEYEDCVSWELFIRMEFLESFSEYCAGRDFTEDETIRLGIDLSQALCCLKKESVIHRDIKPENIFVSRFGNFKLGDFGIARRMEKSTGPLSRKGTDSYMAPEIYRGGQYDGRADICSLGLVLYRLMNRNRLPFVNLDKQLITYRDKELALEKRMSGEEMVPPVDAGPELAEIILHACAFDPENRYQEPEELLSDLIKLQNRKRSGKTDNTAATGRKRLSLIKTSSEKRRADDAGKRKVSDKKTLSRYVLPGILGLLLVVILSILGTVFYMKQMLKDVILQQSQQMMSSLQQSGGTAQQGSTLDFNQSLNLINERMNVITQEQGGSSIQGKAGDKIYYYNTDGELRIALVYPEASDEKKFEQYFYWGDMLFFAYVWDDKESDVYYYRDGILIRWVDSGYVPHDNEQDNQEYVERGDKYWAKSLEVRHE